MISKWEPAPDGYAVDTSNGSVRYGEIVRTDHGLFILRPPGGGAEWPASSRSLREPSSAEWAVIRTLITPVPMARPHFRMAPPVLRGTMPIIGANGA